jgi:hypothetical protein
MPTIPPGVESIGNVARRKPAWATTMRASRRPFLPAEPAAPEVTQNKEHDEDDHHDDDDAF